MVKLVDVARWYVAITTNAGSERHIVCLEHKDAEQCAATWRKRKALWVNVTGPVYHKLPTYGA